MLSIQKNNLNLMERVGGLKSENHRLKHILSEHGIGFKGIFNTSATTPTAETSQPLKHSDEQADQK